MVNYECSQCGTLVSAGFSEPSECENCGNTEFERIGGSSTGPVSLGIDSFVRLCVGLIVLNVVFGFIGLVTVGPRAIVSLFVSVAVLGTVAWLNSNRSRVGWLLGLGLFGLSGLGGVLVLLGAVQLGSLLATGLGAFYVLVSLVALATLLGGASEVW